MSFGEKLRELRVSKGWSQSELAAELGSTQRAVSYWENGVAEPSLTQAYRLAELLDADLTWLLKPDDDSAAKDTKDQAKPTEAYTGSPPRKGPSRTKGKGRTGSGNDPSA